MTGPPDPELDWMEIVATANEEFCTSILYRRLMRSEHAVSVDPDVLNFLAELERANRERNRRLWTFLSEVVGALNSAGLTPLLIKGAVDLARQPDPGDAARILVDTDLLIAPQDLAVALHVLQGLRLKPLEHTAHVHSPGSFWRPGEVGPVDLHTALPPGVASFLSPDDMCRVTLQERDSVRFYAPNADLHALIMIGHEMLHDRGLLSGWTQLKYLVDLADQFTDPSLDWNWLAAKRQMRVFGLALDVQRLMAERLLGIRTDRLARPTMRAQLLHRRRVLKLRWTVLGQIEWRILRYCLRQSNM
ncbi:nucleotidyltransferase family protein [Palleronia aestuarii]|nr:nucleotidyltransferase family protein [Palleronia aestuarii]